MTKVKSILIIEDETNMRARMEKAFKKDDEYDFDVVGVASAGEASDILQEREKRIDVVIIDWRLGPLKNGGMHLLDFIKSLKIYLPKIKIVYTAYANLEDCVKAVKAGADDYIDKKQPGSLLKLINSVKNELKAWAFDEHEPDPQWLKENLSELKEKYQGELIAFIDGKIVAHGSTEDQLSEEVNKQFPGIIPFIMYAPVEA